MLFVSLTVSFVYTQEASPVRIEFDEQSKRIDMVTGRELSEYNLAQRGSFQFFTKKLDEPESFIRYFHDGSRTLPLKNLQSMEKFSKKFAQWKLKIIGRREVPQYIPRIHTFAVSFVPLNPVTGEPDRRVYLLLDNLKLIDWSTSK
jgi:hypothetical protein